MTNIDDHLIHTLAPELIKKQASNYGAKLTMDERCAILGLAKHGVKREVLAVAFSLDKRTIGHISNEASRHYKDVRTLYRQLGHAAFIEKYVTPEIVDRVSRVRVEQVVPAQVHMEPSKRQSQKRGIQVVKPEQCAYSHRLEIQWLDDGSLGAGWYFRDMDCSEPEEWQHSGQASLLSSNAALVMAMENLVDG